MTDIPCKGGTPVTVAVVPAQIALHGPQHVRIVVHCPNHWFIHNTQEPVDMRHSVEVEPSFPLTPTLSLGERGQSAPAACFAHTRAANTIARMAQGRRTILPLPGGEGWNEGKQMKFIQWCHKYLSRV